MLPKKHLSGAQKRKKRKQDELFVESQRGALDKFFSVSSNVSVNEDQGQESGHEQEHDHNLAAKVEVNEDATAPGEQSLIAEVEINEEKSNEENLHTENPNGWGAGIGVEDIVQSDVVQSVVAHEFDEEVATVRVGGKAEEVEERRAVEGGERMPNSLSRLLAEDWLTATRRPKRRLPHIPSFVAGLEKMVAFAAASKSLKNPNFQSTISHLFRFQSARTLLVQSVSESVKLQKLADSDSGIWEVNLERPSSKNAIGRDMLRGLKHTLESVNRDQTAKVLMISSFVPKVFCAGADLKALCIPTIAVIEGAALGGGLEMALSCDLRICGENALLGLPETGLAIIPGAGGTQRLPRLVGKSTAKELIFTGRIIDGKDALSMGLVNYCVPAGEAHLKALEIARLINQKGPVAIRTAKRAIDGGMEVDMESGLVLEEECYEQIMHTKDRLEGLAAFAEKRKPNYIGR
ncbi:hypothetical protein SASPL_106479 [Salvia splendens]|uniref:Methylglutaconyl-CoA hydratase n=1 Tax=Salvia splendens TaxID=180675 RepID=A0A8X8YL17_SALSN|nr:hypothetical protein SASPL_106479 [Salvia splendens]